MLLLFLLLFREGDVFHIPVIYKTEFLEQGHSLAGLGNEKYQNVWFKNQGRDLPGGPAVRTSSSAGCAGSTAGQWAKIPHAFQPKSQNKNISNTVTNSIKTFKNGPYLKKKKILKKN